MIGLVHRISRAVCPPADRRWIDALFAEAQAVSGRHRFIWTLGAAGVLLDRYVRQIAGVLSPASLPLLGAVLLFGWLAIIEYEGFAFEDDWYAVLAVLALIGLLAFSVWNLKRRNRSSLP